MSAFIKAGLALNSVLIGYGYINGKFGKNYTNIDDKNIHSSKNKPTEFNFSEFEKKLKDFQTNEDYKDRTELKIISREENIKKLSKNKFDILIIGGGCSGAGVLLEAYQRGLNCALIEAGDFAGGTSSRSTKLIHGGIRYLEEVFTWPPDGAAIEKFKLVFEALKERDFLINSAPFMNKLVEIKIPYKNLLSMDYYFSGLIFYHLLYAIHNFPNFFNTYPGPRIYFKQKFVSFFEGQMFDSRQALLTILATTKENYIPNCKSTTISNYIEYTDYIYNIEGRIVGVNAKDILNNKEFEIKADQVVNCTGIYADSNFGKNDELIDKLITTSKGSHLMLDKNVLNLDSAFMIPKTTDGRVLFILPYNNFNHWLIGTTDTFMEKTRTPFIHDDDVSYIKGELKAYFKDLTDENLNNAVSSKWAGYRPLVQKPEYGTVTRKIARNHIVRFNENTGLVSLLGGKWTTYRQMGVDVMNKIFEVNKTLKEKEVNNKITSGNLKLPGGYNPENIEKTHLSYDEECEFYNQLRLYLMQKYLIPENMIKIMIFRFGLNTLKILDIYNEITKDNKNDVTMVNDLNKAQIIYTSRYEMVVRPNDYICRRSGIAFFDLKHAESEIDNVSQVLGSEFKWSKSKISLEKENSIKNLKYLI